MAARSLHSASEVPKMRPGTQTFSMAVNSLSRWWNWNTNPTCTRWYMSRSWLLNLERGLPLKRISPEVGVSSMPTRFKKVDLPDPEEPVRATSSPSSIEKFTPLRISSSSPVSENTRRRSIVCKSLSDIKNNHRTNKAKKTINAKKGTAKNDRNNTQ